MADSSPRLRTGFAVAILALASVCVQAQSSVKSPPRLPPNPAESARIPAGVDTGTPTTTDALPLGLAVPPASAEGRLEQSTRSAAARAAQRPSPVAPAANDCLSAEDAALRRSMSQCSSIANRSDRATCAADAARSRRDSIDAGPVALPGSGFVGSTAPASSRAAATGNGARAGCV